MIKKYFIHDALLLLSVLLYGGAAEPQPGNYFITAPLADESTFLIYLASQPDVTLGGGAT